MSSLITTQATLFRQQLQAGRLLGLDYSPKRCGVALSNRQRRLATPLTTLSSAKKKLLHGRINALCRDWQPVSGFVIGLPLMMATAGESRSARRVRSFAALLSDSRLPVLLWDERLSSRQAGQFDGDTDAIAATIILQTALDRLQNL